MNNYIKIIVWLLEQMLHKDKPLFTQIKKMQIFVSDDIRRIEIIVDGKGVRYNG